MYSELTVCYPARTESLVQQCCMTCCPPAALTIQWCPAMPTLLQIHTGKRVRPLLAPFSHQDHKDRYNLSAVHEKFWTEFLMQTTTLVPGHHSFNLKTDYCFICCAMLQVFNKLTGKNVTHSQLWETNRTSVLTFLPNPGHIQSDLNESDMNLTCLRDTLLAVFWFQSILKVKETKFKTVVFLMLCAHPSHANGGFCALCNYWPATVLKGGEKDWKPLRSL